MRKSILALTVFLILALSAGAAKDFTILNDTTTFFQVNGTTGKVYVMGNLGIGTFIPNQKLVVIGNANITQNIYASQICDEAGSNCKDISGGWGGEGDVTGPASATDNAIVRFDQTTGKLIQNSGVIINDANNVQTVGWINATTGIIKAQGGLHVASTDGTDGGVCIDNDTICPNIAAGDVAILNGYLCVDNDDGVCAGSTDGYIYADALYVAGGTTYGFDTSGNLIANAASVSSAEVGTDLDFTDFDNTLDLDAALTINAAADSRHIIINEDSYDIDVRIEGSTDANLFFTDGGNNRVGIGTSSPNQKLVVVGNANITQNITAKYICDETGSNCRDLSGVWEAESPWTNNSFDIYPSAGYPGHVNITANLTLKNALYYDTNDPRMIFTDSATIIYLS